jgi:hypothetical protein
MSATIHTAADCQAALKKHGSKAEAARALGMHVSSFKRRMGGAQPLAKTAAKAAPASQARSLAEFRATFDKDTIFPQKINAALSQLGKDGWAYEVEFAKLAGIGLAQLAIYRETYAEQVVQLGRDSKRAWAGSKALAAKMREML